MTVDRPELRQAQAVLLDGPHVFLRQADVRDREVVRAQRDRDAGPVEGGQRMRRHGFHDPGLDIGGRAQIERDAPAGKLPAQLGVVDRERSVRDPLGVNCERPPDLRGAAPLAGVDRDPQPTGARGLEGAGMIERVREGGLRSGEVPAGEALVDEARRCLREDRVVGRVVGAEGGADEAHARAGSFCRHARPATDRRDPVGQRQPARDVEQRAPADLDVADVVRGLRGHQLGGDPLECLRVLHQRDRQVEGAQQLGLVGAALGRDERVVHPCPAGRGIHAASARQLERGVHPDRTIEVEMELRLGHRFQQPAERPAGDARDGGGGVWVGHRPMLRFRAVGGGPALHCRDEGTQEPVTPK